MATDGKYKETAETDTPHVYSGVIYSRIYPAVYLLQGKETAHNQISQAGCLK